MRGGGVGSVGGGDQAGAGAGAGDGEGWEVQTGSDATPLQILTQETLG